MPSRESGSPIVSAKTVEQRQLSRFKKRAHPVERGRGKIAPVCKRKDSCCVPGAVFISDKKCKRKRGRFPYSFLFSISGFEA